MTISSYRKKKIQRKYNRHKFLRRNWKSLPRAIDPDDVKKIIRVIKAPRDRAMFLMLLRTGMRIGELLKIELSDINLEEQKVLISESLKSHQGRVVYFSKDAKAALKKWLKQRVPRRKVLFYSPLFFWFA